MILYVYCEQELPRVQERLVGVYDTYEGTEENCPEVLGQTVPDYVEQKWASHDRARNADKTSKVRSLSQKYLTSKSRNIHTSLLWAN